MSMNPFSLQLERLARHPWSPVFLGLLAMLLALPSVWTGWQQDDLTHRFFLLGHLDFQGTRTSPLNMFDFLNGDPERTRGMVDLGLLPWWTANDIRLSFWRPLTAATHWVDYALWPNSAALMHIQNLVWFGGFIMLVVLLYRRYLGATWVAALAGLLFAIDDAHGLPAGWIANRNTVLSAFFGALVLLVHDRWRRESWRHGALLGPGFLILGLLSGEAALAVLGYLVAYSIFLDRGSRRQRVIAFVPYGVIAGLWLMAYTMMGYGTSGSEFYVNPMSEPIKFVAVFFERAPLLLLDQLGFPPSSIRVLLQPTAVLIIWLWAMVFLFILGTALAPLIRHDPTARFWALGMILSIPPICATMPHSRLLFLAGIGGMGLVAQFLGGFTEGAKWSYGRTGRRLIGRGVLVLLVVVHGIIAPLLLPLNAVSAATAEPYIQKAVNDAPLGPDLAAQDLILVNPPIMFYAHALLTVRTLEGVPMPRHLRVLAPGLVQLEVSRPDERTLVIRPDGGFLAFPFDNLFRKEGDRFYPGERVELTNLSVEIVGLTADGRPSEVAFRFSVPLEDPSLKWLKWEDGTYAPFEPPKPGSRILLKAAQLKL